MRPVIEVIGGVGVDHEADARETLAQGFDGFDVLAGFDFYFDSLVSGGKLALDGGN